MAWVVPRTSHRPLGMAGQLEDLPTNRSVLGPALGEGEVISQKKSGELDGEWGTCF